MFKKLFGETDQEQIQFLHYRSIATIAILLLVVLALILSSIGINEGARIIIGVAEKGFAIIMLFIWGWPVLKKLFGITALAALFSGNVMIGVVLFVVYIALAYFLGILFAFIGTARYIYLRVKYGKKL